MTDKTLYQINGTQDFGTYLATNSQGKMILELKPSGEIKTVDPSEVSEVFPFTFGVKFAGGSKEYQYLGKEGSVNLGDILMVSNPATFSDGETTTGICKVTSVNTKSKSATRTFKGVRVVTEALPE